jgi:hypothetical protein
VLCSRIFSSVAFVQKARLVPAGIFISAQELVSRHENRFDRQFLRALNGFYAYRELRPESRKACEKANGSGLHPLNLGWHELPKAP